MASDVSSEGYEKAAERVDRALQRLEASLRSFNGRVRSVGRIESDIAKLENDRGQLVGELARSAAKSKRLDEAAGDVSRRLVVAMESVKTILSDEEKH